MDMLCTAPVKAGGTEFPCGQCIACRINQARKWNTRLRLEWFHSNSETGLPGAFVTLTYAPEHLPVGGTLVKRDAQLFMKRVRFHLREDTGRFCRYYLVGEYGEALGRPHYHAMLFGVDPRWVEVRSRMLWPFGHVHVGTISESSLAYVADYSLKERKGRSSCSEGKIPQFRLMSRRPGIGGPAWGAVARALSGEAIADDVDVYGAPREVRLPAGERRSELMPLDRYMVQGVEKLLGQGGRAYDNFSRLLMRCSRLPVLSEEEKEERRKLSASKALSKKARRARKAQL